MKKLKNLVAVILLSATLFSCDKDKNCNCGIITDDEIEFDANGDIYYSLTIKNQCSDNLGKYYFSQSVWMDAPVGSNFCVTNVSSWMPVGPTTTVELENNEKEI